MKIRRILFPSLAMMVIILSAVLRESNAAPVCTYNNATLSFDAGYTANQVSSQDAGVCSNTASNPISGAHLATLNRGVAATTAPNTGDFKFLMKGAGSNTLVPTFGMVSSMAPDTKVFPDSTIAVPAVGPGCDDNVATGTGGIRAIESHLHRPTTDLARSAVNATPFPMFGLTYYYGDYIANPPNVPSSVTLLTSPYVKWTPYNSSLNTPLTGGDEYIYMDPTNDYGAPQTYGWGPVSSNGLTADQMHPLMKPGHADACVDVAGLTAAERTQCRSCLTNRGYYLHDGATAGDLKKSVFKGAILNDYPPAWVHLAWGFGYVLDFQLTDSSGNNPLFALVRDQYQSQNSVGCPSPAGPNHAGGSYEPIGQADCSIAYPKYDWPRIKALGMGPVTNDMANMQGGNSAWCSAQTFSGTLTSPSTPAGDILAVANAVQNFVTSTCSFCQTKAVLYIGFGIPCAEGKPSIPAQSIAPCTGECNYVSPAAQCNCGSGTDTNWLPQTARYLRDSLNFRVYFLGMGPHTKAMQRAAVEGRGKFFNATDAESFRNGLFSILQEVIGTATSSATSTVNAVQVNVAGQEELVPRFVALQATPDGGTDGGAGITSAIWDGHLYKYFLFSEFAGNCSKAGDLVPIPNSAATVCDAGCVCAGGSCNGRWLLDSQCSLISPDNTGFFFKATYAADAGNGLKTTTTPAVPVWDANSEIAKVNWYQRPVYTAIDTTFDGLINTSDGNDGGGAGMYLITSGAGAGNLDLTGGVSDTVASALLPYLGIQGNGTCSNIESALGKILPGDGGQTARDIACARVILNFALGEDLLDQYQNGTLVNNRLSMLGDIFHSSPQDIGPPSAELLCGLNTRRCTTTLFNAKKGNGVAAGYMAMETPSTVVNPDGGTASNSTLDAYDAYYQDQTFGMALPRVSVFGANDGMVHAIQTGCYVKSSVFNNPILPAPVPVPVYWEGVGTGSGANACVAGSKANGTELWAFIPPDLLPKLSQLLLGNHQFFVDGTPMVRDIYVSSGPTKSYNSTNKDYKRIAIFGEREGGTHWFGIDVTDPRNPAFNWLFPQPNSADELKTGFTFDEWQPAAPPIIPIRMKASGGSYPTYNATSFKEQWVALLPGGYDPYGVRGKSLYMLDAFTGSKIWEGTGNTGQDFAITAMPAAVPWGTQEIVATTPAYNNGYFDTAVVGDLGGQMWTVRFNDPGNVSGSTGLVDNWFMARSFRQAKADDSGVSPYKMQHRTPIFQMASVARLNEGTLRAFVSTGDRANMSEKALGQCSVYNPLACGKQNCVTTIALNSSVGTKQSASGVSSYDGSAAATYTSSSTFNFATNSECAPASTVLNECIVCSGTGAASNNTPSPPAQPQYACVNGTSGSVWQCGNLPIDPVSPSSRLETSTQAVPGSVYSDRGYYSRFLAYNVFGASGSTRAIFKDTSATSTYDGAALTETTLFANLFPSGSFDPVTPPTLAPVAGLDGTKSGYYFTFPMVDERTATNSLLLQNCVSWYTMAPGAPCNTNADCPSGAICDTVSHECAPAATTCSTSSTDIPARTAFLYQINATDGSTNCGLTSSTGLRSRAPASSFIVPPPPAQPLISVNAGGILQYSIIAPAGQLSPPAAAAGTGGASNYSFYYTIEVPKDLHSCRHANDPNSCQ